MREEFLHYLWQHQKWKAMKLHTTEGIDLCVISPGRINTDAGPDFFNAKLKVDQQLWAGNIEIHIRSSDWYAHQHHKDNRYNSVILHVVWHHDVEVYREDETSIPVLELNKYISKTLLKKYEELFQSPQSWIACQNSLHKVSKFTTNAWLERMYLDRLERKANELLHDAEQSKYHWEALLFMQLAKSFGLNVNGDAFYQMAISIPFHVIQKSQYDVLELEALMFGQAGLLNQDVNDKYHQDLKQKYLFLKNKFSLVSPVLRPKFFRLRPDNFPTIRLSQLASLYHQNSNLFSDWMKDWEVKEFYTKYRVKASQYWDLHYNFGVASKSKAKYLSKNFMELIWINTLIPMRFVYFRYLGQDNSEKIMTEMQGLKAEHNSIVQNYSKFGLEAKNALQSQALLQLYNTFCRTNRCLSCEIGNTILKASEKSIRDD